MPCPLYPQKRTFAVSLLCLRCPGQGATPEVLAENYEPEGFVGGISIMVIDKTGEAARIKLDVAKKQATVEH
jgi:hypothetical protein